MPSESRRHVFRCFGLVYWSRVEGLVLGFRSWSHPPNRFMPRTVNMRSRMPMRTKRGVTSLMTARRILTCVCVCVCVSMKTLTCVCVRVCGKKDLESLCMSVKEDLTSTGVQSVGSGLTPTCVEKMATDVGVEKMDTNSDGDGSTHTRTHTDLLVYLREPPQELDEPYKLRHHTAVTQSSHSHHTVTTQSPHSNIRTHHPQLVTALACQSTP